MNGFDGALNIVVRTENGRVREVRIASPRKNVAPIFKRRRPAEAANLAKSLFSLCPVAQSLACQAAGEAALGETPDKAELRLRALRLLCERAAEMLRGSLLDWPQVAALEAESVEALRETLHVLRALPDSPGDAALFARAEQAAERLGLRQFKQGNGAFARQWAEAVADESFWNLRPRKPDCLRPTDDEDVAAAMMDPNFAMGPHLAGRSVETAGLARLARDFAPTLSGRLAARFAEMAATLDSIGALVAGGEAPDDLVTAKNTGAGASFAAVESARGRLYHAMRLDGDGRIADYAILAPTEWNFHPEGPFVQSLRDGSIGTGEQARLRVARLAFVFDPCIRVGVDLRDSADA